jgi:hypothetical protein
MFDMYLDPTYYSSGDTATVNYYGFGEGIDVNDVVQTNSLKLYLWNTTGGGSWEEIGSNISSAAENLQAYTISGVAPTFTVGSDYVNGNDYVRLLAAADTLGQDSHRLNTDYVSISSSDGNHTGNHADIYIEAPSKMATATLTKVVSNGAAIINLSSTETLGPVQDIISVSVSSVALADDEWSFHYVEPSMAFSDGAKIRIVPIGDYALDSTALDVTYSYLLEGSSMQSTVESSSFRSPSADNLIKVMPPYTIIVNDFPYEGNVTVATMQDALETYINELTEKTLSKTDLIAVALDAGATDVSLSDIDVTIRYQTVQGQSLIVTMGNKYTITNLGKFYTSTAELGGVTQI